MKKILQKLLGKMENFEKKLPRNIKHILIIFMQTFDEIFQKLLRLNFLH